tara:strand:- start:69 stop:476 length:408 start_codon:yes stop_codon:yes gene_type:complete
MKGGSDLENMNMDEFTNLEESRDLKNDQQESNIKKVFIDTTTDLNYNSSNDSDTSYSNDSDNSYSSDIDNSYSNDSDNKSTSSIDDFTDLNDIQTTFENLDLNEFQKGGSSYKNSNEKKEFKIIDLEDTNEDIII